MGEQCVQSLGTVENVGTGEVRARCSVDSTLNATLNVTTTSVISPGSHSPCSNDTSPNTTTLLADGPNRATFSADGPNRATFSADGQNRATLLAEGQHSAPLDPQLESLHPGTGGQHGPGESGDNGVQVELTGGTGMSFMWSSLRLLSVYFDLPFRRIISVCAFRFHTLTH